MENTPRYAVVDLEATGTAADAKIIQVGIVLVQNGKIVDRYATDVNPHERLTDHIRELTGITDEQLAKAPTFSQVARDIYERLEGTIFVAHNVRFDANLLAEALFFEGYDLFHPRVDTVELAQVFFPTLDRYNLGHLTKQLGIDLQHAHTAIADAEATAHLLVTIQEKIASLPKITVEKILERSDQLIYESHLVIQEVYDRMSEITPAGVQVVHGIALRQTKGLFSPRYLSRSFSHNIQLLGLEERPQQEKLAQAIQAHMEEGAPHFLQAQAGMGKTYAYLLTLLAHSDQQIIVSVPTKILQDQIMSQEARRISEVFQINVHSLKGPANYLKLDAFVASLDQPDANRMESRYKMQLLVWLLETTTGDLDEIQQKQRYQAYFDTIRHDGDLPATSLFSEVDFWERSYTRSQQCQVLLTNHAYLLTRMEDDREFIRGKWLVLDEAQKFFLTLESFSHREINFLETFQELQSHLDKQTDLLTKRVLESIQFQLSQLLSVWKRKSELSQDHLQQLRLDLSECPKGLLPGLEDFFARKADDVWITSQRKEGKGKVYQLHAGSLDFLDFSAMLPEGCQVLALSATIEISPSVSVPQLLGFRDYRYTEIPSTMAAQQAVWVPKDMPLISEMTQAEHSRYITQQIREFLPLRKPILVLFQSNDLLASVSDCLQEAEISHLAQQDGASFIRLKRRFEEGDSPVLLGSIAFWEGVDFASLDEMMVLVTRIPFDSPEDPFSKKIAHYFKRQGKGSFYTYSLPMALLRLKQALGRSTRRAHQVSAVVLLDHRLYTKRYGSVLRRGLEMERPVYAVGQTDLFPEIQAFFDKEKEKEK